MWPFEFILMLRAVFEELIEMMERMISSMPLLITLNDGPHPLLSKVIGDLEALACRVPKAFQVSDERPLSTRRGHDELGARGRKY
mmetsp:Transcript_168/g.275  ORF Transcript_168/g.275 Transcript_168/m.275 type:complete len:85 (-) Transcript_168:12-266(-)